MCCILFLFVSVTWDCYISHCNHMKDCSSKLCQHCFLDWVAPEFLGRIWTPERHGSGLQLILVGRKMQKCYGPGSSRPAPNVPDSCGMRCLRREWAFLPQTRQLGSIYFKNILFINLFKPSYILVASEKGHTSFDASSGRELALYQSLGKYLTLNCVLEHRGLHHGLCFCLFSSPNLLK